MANLRGYIYLAIRARYQQMNHEQNLTGNIVKIIKKEFKWLFCMLQYFGIYSVIPITLF